MICVKRFVSIFLGSLALFMALNSGGDMSAGGAGRPAIVLTAFGTSTAAAETYKHIETRVRERFPGYEIRWAFTSQKIRQKLRREGGQELQDLRKTLQELKAAGVTRVAVQSLHVVPGKEWKEMVRESRQVPGLKVALGKPLLSSEADRHQVLKELARTFPADLQKNAVVLVGHGSPEPEGESAYKDLEGMVRRDFPGQNVFLGVIEGEPGPRPALEAVKRSAAEAVYFVPLMVVSGDHMLNDILGDSPESWKSRLLAHRPYRIESLPGLGYQNGAVEIFLQHLETALKQLAS